MPEEDTSIEINNAEEIETQDQYEHYEEVEYTGRENPWDLIMWGLTNAHPNLAKTAEITRLAISKPSEFIANTAYTIYLKLEDITGAKSGFTAPFTMLLGAVLKGMLTGNETNSRFDNFQTVVKRRKIESKNEMVDHISKMAENIPEKEISQNLKHLSQLATNKHVAPTVGGISGKNEISERITQNLDGKKLPISNGTIHHSEHMKDYKNIASNDLKTPQKQETMESHVNSLRSNNKSRGISI